MVDNNHVELINQKSFVNQKFNLWSNEVNEVFLIPTFTLITTPVTSAQNVSCYEIFFQVSYVYYKTNITDLTEGTNFGCMSNLIFQYDLNYSKEATARGQIILFKNLGFKLSHDDRVSDYLFDISNLKDWKIIPPTALINLLEFRILLPVKAVKKDAINTLHYSFNASRESVWPWTLFKWHINNKNNMGSFNFYINHNPKYQLQTVPKILDQKINILTINNPLIFQSFIPKIGLFNFNFDDSSGLGIINGKSLLDETFNFIFNNLNSLQFFPLKVQYYLKYNEYFSGLINLKFWTFVNNYLKIQHGGFNLGQNLSLNIIDNNDNIGFKKIDANLVNIFNSKDNKKHIDFQEYFLKINNEHYSYLTNEIINNFPFPYDKKIDFIVNMSLKFKTFFDYDINFNFIEHTISPIIGDSNNLIKTIISDKKFSDIIWNKKDKITLSYDQIRKYYISDNFNFNDYESLLSREINNDF